MEHIHIKRVLAGLTDFYIVCLLGIGLVWLWGGGKVESSAVTVVLYLTSFFLLILFKDIALRGASLGKRIFKLRVVKVDGSKLRLSDALKRTIPAVFYIPGELYLLLVGDTRQGDRWAKTTVVPREP